MSDEINTNEPLANAPWDLRARWWMAREMYFRYRGKDLSAASTSTRRANLSFAMLLLQHVESMRDESKT